MSYQLTKEQSKKEFLKCGRDVEYFITKYVQIQHPVKGFIPFKLFEYQKDVVKELRRNKNNIILKSRQLGMSTLAAAYILHICLFKRGQKIVIVSQKQKSSADVLKKIKLAWSRLPSFFSQWVEPKSRGREIGSYTTLEFTNGSSVHAEATTEHAARGGALSLLVIDEAAAIDNKQINDMWAAVKPTLALGGSCLIISTPNGVGNFYHKTWVSAINGENNFNPIELHWSQHPDYDQAWYEEQCKDLSPTQIAQEYDCSFENSGDTFFDKNDLKRIAGFVDAYRKRTVFFDEWCNKIQAFDEEGEKTLRQIPEKAWIDRNYWVWERPLYGYTYVIGVDVSRGDSKDYSTLVVLKQETGEVVAEYKGKSSTIEFASLIDSVGYEYGEAMVVVENNTYGFTVLQELIKLEYPNIFYSHRSTYQYCSPEEAMYEQGNVVAGLSTGPRSRPLFLAKLEEYVRNNYLTIYSTRLNEELKTFIYHNGKPQAQEGSHDDLIMALTMAVWAKEIAFSRVKKQSQFSKALLKSMVMDSSTLDTRIGGMIGFEDKMRKAADWRQEKKRYEKAKSYDPQKKKYWPSIIKS